MKEGLVVLGGVMVVASLVILSVTDGGFFMYGLIIVGGYFIFRGVTEK